MTDQEILDFMRPPGPLRDGLIEFCRRYVKPEMRIVELGSFAGASSRIIFEHMTGGHLYCVDHWIDAWGLDNHVVNEAAERMFDQFAADNPCVTKLKLESAVAAKLIEDGTIDLLYIDANHEFEHVQRDLLLWRPKLRPDGVCAGHDYNWPGVKRAVDALFPVEVFADWTWCRA